MSENVPYLSKDLTLSLIEQMRTERFKLSSTLYHTSKWRVIKRYRLHEKLYKLDGDIGLIGHVMLNDEY